MSHPTDTARDCAFLTEEMACSIRSGQVFDEGRGPKGFLFSFRLPLGESVYFTAARTLGRPKLLGYADAPQAQRFLHTIYNESGEEE